MTFFAQHYGFPALGNHRTFPDFFTFQVFESMNVMNFVAFAVSTATELTDVRV